MDIRTDVQFWSNGTRVTCYVPEGGRQVEERVDGIGWVLTDGNEEGEPFSRDAERLLAMSSLWRAAPDLLAACKKALGLCEGMLAAAAMIGGREAVDEGGELDSIRAAIARAEGRDA